MKQFKCRQAANFAQGQTKFATWGVGHCFAWHVRVNIGFYFDFKIEELVDSVLTDIWDIIAYFLLPELKYYYKK